MNHRKLSFPALVILLISGGSWAATLVETIDSGFTGSGGATVGPDGNIYVSDYGRNLSNANGTTIWKITPDGERSAFVTGLSGASGSDFDSQGNLYQSHLNGGTLRRITPDGQMSVFSSGFSGPIGVAVNSKDEVFVANCGSNSIRKAVEGGTATQFATSALFSCPNGLTADADDNLYSVNFNDNRMVKIDPAGQVSQFAVIPGGGNGHVRYHDGFLYAVSWQGNRLYRVSLAGEVELLAGNGLAGRDDGPGESAQFFRPNGIDVSADGSIVYINDTDTIGPTDLLHTNSLRAVYLDALTEMNPGIVGSWFDANTNGSGFLFDLIDEDEFFGAWYTYVTPDSDIDAGENEQRWFTLQGTWAGNVATVEIFQTTGGRLLSPDDPTNTEAVGDATITFITCTRANVSFQFHEDEEATNIRLNRLSPDVLCEHGGFVEEAEQEPVTLRFVGNLGVMIQFQDQQVVIDAVTGPLGGWVAPSSADTAAMTQGTDPFDDVEVAAFTHNHGDHVSINAINNFLNNQPNTQFIGPVAAGLGSVSKQGQVREISLIRFDSQQMTVNGIPITVYHTRHFNQFGNDFSTTTNLAYLVELGGRKILHVGDFDYAADNIEALSLEPGEVDAIIMPTFNTLISANNFSLITDMLAPGVIVAAHFQSGQLLLETTQVGNLLPDAVIFDTAGETFLLD